MSPEVVEIFSEVLESVEKTSWEIFLEVEEDYLQALMKVLGDILVITEDLLINEHQEEDKSWLM